MKFRKLISKMMENSTLANTFKNAINKVIELGEIPNQLKISCVTPIPKINNAIDAADFRPINNLPVIEKIIESNLLNQIETFIEDNKIMTIKQHGFRKNFNTSTAVMSLLNFWINAIENNEIVVTVFLDFKRAFETINREILIEKLRKYNFSEKTITLLKSYLSQRKQFVKVDGIHSDLREVNCGIPQGSKLSSILFNLYINDLVINTNAEVVMYADDTTLSVKAKTTYEAIHIMNNELEKINDWVKFNKILLNKNKCNYMIVNKPNKKKNIRVNENEGSDVQQEDENQEEDEIEVEIDDVPLEKVGHTKYLGITLDKNLKFNLHAESIIKKVSKKLGLFRRIQRKFNFETKLIYYNSLVQPHFDYCSFIFDFIDKKYMDKLRVLQNHFLRVITNSPSDARIQRMLERTKIIPIEKRIRANILKSIYFILEKSPSDLKRHIYRNRDIRSRTLRFADCFRTPDYKKTVSKKFIFYKGLADYNKFLEFCKKPENVNNRFNLNYINYCN